MANTVSYSVTYRYTFDVYRMLMRGDREKHGWTLAKRILLMEALLLAIALTLTLLQGGFAPFWQLRGARLLEAAGILVASALALAVAIAVIDFVFDRYLYRLVFRRSSSADTDVTVRLNGDGLECSREGIASKVAWSAIKELTILKDRAACLLWFGKREALVLPRAAFSGESEFDAACSFIKGQLRAA